MDFSTSCSYWPQEGKKLKLGYKMFPYELGGVRTGQKLQGATTPRLTCNFNPRPKGIRTNLSHRSFFVSISRVKSIDHFRIIPMIGGDRSKLDYMKKFSMDAKLHILPLCYNEHGEWVATTDDIVKWFDEYGIPWRPKATKKRPFTAKEVDILRRYPVTERDHDDDAQRQITSRKRGSEELLNQQFSDSGSRRKSNSRSGSSSSSSFSSSSTSSSSSSPSPSSSDSASSTRVKLSNIGIMTNPLNVTPMPYSSNYSFSSSSSSSSSFGSNSSYNSNQNTFTLIRTLSDPTDQTSSTSDFTSSNCSSSTSSKRKRSNETRSTSLSISAQNNDNTPCLPRESSISPGKTVRISFDFNAIENDN